MKKITLKQEAATESYRFHIGYGKWISLCPRGVWWEFPELEDETEIDLYAVKVEDVDGSPGDEWVLMKVFNGWVHIWDEDGDYWECAFYPLTNAHFIQYFALELSDGCFVKCQRAGDNPPDLGLVG